MNEYNTIKEIVDLIILEINEELSPAEKATLKNWIDENPHHLLIYNQIKNSTKFNEWKERREDVDSALAFQSVYAQIRENKKRQLFQFIVKFAAAIIFPIMIAGGVFLYLTADKTTITEQVEMAEIKPGAAKAILKLDNGQVVELDSLKNETLQESDGTTIAKVKGVLNYTKDQPRSKSKKVIYNTIEIPRGGEFNLLLADGTRVYLNSLSRLKYPVNFTGKNREVELSGEAYFEVAHDSQRPFLVKSGNVTTEVLGTSFNVNAYETNAKVVTTLVEGKVKIKSNIDNSVERILAPDEQASFDVVTGNVDVNTVNVNLYTAWKEGKLIFYDNRLEEIMNVLTRWYSAEVAYQSPLIKDLRFSGKLNRYGEIDQILDIIKATKKVEIEINNNTILFKEK